jgi:hypothetical protein
MTKEETRKKFFELEEDKEEDKGKEKLELEKFKKELLENNKQRVVETETRNVLLVGRSRYFNH